MKQKSIKLGIGFLIAVIMLGTALFSIQAFTGSFQPENGRSSALFASPDAVETPQNSQASHTMDNNPEAKGFLAAPWIPVSFIRQSMRRDVSLEKINKLIRIYTIKSYPADKTPDITDSNIRNMTNKGYHLQALSLHIAKLTAG